MINNFGQTPTQLLRRAHPKRKPLQDVDAGKVRVINQIENRIDPRFALIEVLFDSISVFVSQFCVLRWLVRGDGALNVKLPAISRDFFCRLDYNYK